MRTSTVCIIHLALAFANGVIVGTDAKAAEVSRISFVTSPPTKAIRDTPINIGGWIVSQVSPSLPVSVQLSAEHGILQIGNGWHGSFTATGENTSTLTIKATAFAANETLQKADSIRFCPSRGYTGNGRISIRVFFEATSIHTQIAVAEYHLPVFAAPLEAWLAAHFGSDAVEPTSERTRGYSDPDKDGKTNRLEYATGDHPLTGTVSIAPLRVVPSTHPGSWLEVVLPQRVEDSQMQCSLHYSFDLTNWAVLPLTSGNYYDEATSNGVITRHVIIPGPIASLPGFYRYSVDNKNWLPQVRVTSCSLLSNQLTVSWIDQDEDSNASIAIVLEPTVSPRNWLMVSSGIAEDADGASDSTTLSTLSIPSGDYNVLVIADDGINPPAIARWPTGISILRDEADLDENGIPDYWQSHYASIGRLSDLDRDGFADGQEFLMGTSPLAPNGIDDAQIALASRMGLGASSDSLYLDSAQNGIRKASKSSLNLEPGNIESSRLASHGSSSQFSNNPGGSLGSGNGVNLYNPSGSAWPGRAQSQAVSDANRDGFLDGLPVATMLTAATESATTLDYPAALGLHAIQARLPGDGLVLLTALGQQRIARVSNLNLMPENAGSFYFGALGVLLPSATNPPGALPTDYGRTAPGWAVGLLSSNNLPLTQTDFDGDGLSIQQERYLGLSASVFENISSLVLSPQILGNISSSEPDVLAVSSIKDGTRLASRSTLNIRGGSSFVSPTPGVGTGSQTGLSSNHAGSQPTVDTGIHATDVKGALDLKFGLAGDPDRNGFAVFTDALLLGRTADVTGINVTMSDAVQRVGQYGEITDLLLVSSSGRWHLAKRATLNLQSIPAYFVNGTALANNNSSNSEHGTPSHNTSSSQNPNAVGLENSPLFDAGRTGYSSLVSYLMGGSPPTIGGPTFSLAAINPALSTLLSDPTNPAGDDMLALVSARECVWLAEKRTLDIKGSIGASRRSPLVQFTSPELAINREPAASIKGPQANELIVNPSSVEPVIQPVQTPLLETGAGLIDANRNGFADILDVLFLNRMDPQPSDTIVSRLASQTATFAASRLAGNGVMLTDSSTRLMLADYAALNLQPSRTKGADDSIELTSLMVPQVTNSLPSPGGSNYPTAPGWNFGSSARSYIPRLAADADRDSFAQATELLFQSLAGNAGISSAGDAQIYTSLTTRLAPYTANSDGVVLSSVTGNLYFADINKLNLAVVLGAQLRAGLGDAAIALFQTSHGILPLAKGTRQNNSGHTPTSGAFVAPGSASPPILSTANYQDADRDGLSDAVELAAQFDNASYTNILTVLLPEGFVQAHSNAISGSGLLLITPEQSYSLARYPDLNLITPIQPLITSSP